MTTEQKQKRDELAKLLSGHTQLASLYSNQPSHYLAVADYLLNNGIDVELPSEPQWAPGQWAKVLLNDGPEWRLARRNAANDGWGVFPGGELWRDTEVAEVKPVAVLDAEDVRKLLLSVEATAPIAGPDVLRYFAERGVDVR